MQRTAALVSAAILGLGVALTPQLAIADDGLGPAPKVTVTDTVFGEETVFTVNGCPAGADAVKLEITRAGTSTKLAVIDSIYPAGKITADLPIGKLQVFATCLAKGKEVSATSEARFQVVSGTEGTGEEPTEAVAATMADHLNAGTEAVITLKGFEGNSEVVLTLVDEDGKVVSESLLTTDGKTAVYEVDWVATGQYQVKIKGRTTGVVAVTSVHIELDATEGQPGDGEENEENSQNQKPTTMPKTGN